MITKRFRDLDEAGKRKATKENIPFLVLGCLLSVLSMASALFSLDGQTMWNNIFAQGAFLCFLGYSAFWVPEGRWYVPPKWGLDSKSLSRCIRKNRSWLLGFWVLDMCLLGTFAVAWVSFGGLPKENSLDVLATLFSLELLVGLLLPILGSLALPYFIWWYPKASRRS